jgi:hypothetical protein
MELGWWSHAAEAAKEERYMPRVGRAGAETVAVDEVQLRCGWGRVLRPRSGCGAASSGPVTTYRRPDRSRCRHLVHGRRPTYPQPTRDVAAAHLRWRHRSTQRPRRRTAVVDHD